MLYLFRDCDPKCTLERKHLVINGLADRLTDLAGVSLRVVITLQTLW